MALIKCSECSKEFSDKAEKCPNCGCPNNPKIDCPECKETISSSAKVCPNCGYTLGNKQNNVAVNGKSRIAAGLLGIFLGTLGVHNFYLGYTDKAVGQLLLTILSCGILSFVSAIWGLVEGIMILTGSINTDADGKSLVD